MTFLIGRVDAAVDEQIDSNSFGLFVADVSFSCQSPGLDGKELTATVELSGAPLGCNGYIVKVRGLDSGRVITVDCGFTNELTTKLFVTNFGMTPPQCSVFKEVPISEVKFTKPRPKASKKQR